ncbi:response regulator [bacterium]|nr:response regulator [bacterium]
MNETILVVDDSRFVRQMLQGLLDAADYKVVLAEDGPEAVQVAKDVKPDLILMDVEMPSMDGFTAARTIRESPDCKNAPIIFLTARTDVENKKIAFELGGDDYIVKPFDYEELMLRVERWLAQKREKEQIKSETEQTTFSKVMITLAHHINNALASMQVRRDLIDFESEDSMRAFFPAFDRQTARIKVVVQSLVEMAHSRDLTEADYPTAQTPMLDIAATLEKRLRETEADNNPESEAD